MVERGQGIALWCQIDRALGREIAAGFWQQGEKLPTEQALAARFHVNRHTIRRAIQALVQRGLLRVEQGRGTFIQGEIIDYIVGRRTRFSENMLRNQRYSATRLLDCSEVLPPDSVARQLDLADDAQAIRLNRVSSAGDVPVSISTVYLPAARFLGFEQIYAQTQSITLTLRQFGIDDYVRATTKVTARLPSGHEAQHLKQAPTRPILQSEALDVDLSGRPISVNITRFAGDRVQITLDTDPADKAPPTPAFPS